MALSKGAKQEILLAAETFAETVFEISEREANETRESVVSDINGALERLRGPISGGTLAAVSRAGKPKKAARKAKNGKAKTNRDVPSRPGFKGTQADLTRLLKFIHHEGGEVTPQQVQDLFKINRTQRTALAYKARDLGLIVISGSTRAMRYTLPVAKKKAKKKTGGRKKKRSPGK